MYVFFDQFDRAVAGWMERYGHFILRISLAVIFIWFGILKPLGLSPAYEMVANTVYWFPADIFVPILGWWEVAIGVGLLFRPLLRVALFLLFAQMAGTILPLIILPEMCYTDTPFALTLEGQYIVKNLILISAALVIGGTVRHKKNEEQYL